MGRIHRLGSQLRRLNPCSIHYLLPSFVRSRSAISRGDIHPSTPMKNNRRITSIANRKVHDNIALDIDFRRYAMLLHEVGAFQRRARDTTTAPNIAPLSIYDTKNATKALAFG